MVGLSPTALLDGNKDQLFFKTAGSSLTVGCLFSLSGTTKSFCRGKCAGDKILVQTNGVRAHRGPHRVGYEEGTFPFYPTIIYVTIEQLTRSDSGRYRCRLDRTVGTNSYSDFSVSVVDGEFQNRAFCSSLQIVFVIFCCLCFQ